MLKIESLHDPPEPVKKSGRLKGQSPESAKKSDWLGGGTVNQSSEPVKNPDAIIITNLTSGVRDQNRVNVFINGKYTLSLDARQVIDLHVKVGRQLSEQELQELHQASAFGKLYQRALEWVLMRPRSIQETRTYLKQRQIKRQQNNRQRLRQELKPLPEIQHETTKLVLERLIERGYLDDRRFTEFYVENRFVKKGISQKRLRLELVKKGVPESIICEVLDQAGRNDTDELAKMVAKKAKRYEHDKLIAYLCRQGFGYQDVVEAVEAYEQAAEE